MNCFAPDLVELFQSGCRLPHAAKSAAGEVQSSQERTDRREIRRHAGPHGLSDSLHVV